MSTLERILADWTASVYAAAEREREMLGLQCLTGYSEEHLTRLWRESGLPWDKWQTEAIRVTIWGDGL